MDLPCEGPSPPVRGFWPSGFFEFIVADAGRATWAGMNDPDLRLSSGPPLRRCGLAFLVAAALGATTPDVTAQEVAWARVSPAGQGLVFTPSTSYQYSTAGGTILVARGASNNEFQVTIPGAAPAIGGCVHATALNGNHTAVVQSWLTATGDVQARVALYDSLGGPANDARFTVHWRYEGPFARREAYVFANNATAASYTPSTSYSWNGNRGNPTVTRSAVGTYQVRFPGLAALGDERGCVEITPYGALPVRAKVFNWGNSAGDTVVNVRCFDMTGQPTDSRFICSYCESAAPINERDGSGAYVYANDPIGSFYRPNGTYTDSNGREGPPDAETVRRLGVGRYLVNLPNVAPSGSATALVTAQGSGADYATVDSWDSDGCGGTNVIVTTFDATGGATDTRFVLLFLTNRPAATPIVAWANVEPLGQGQSFVPAAGQQFSTEGDPLNVTRGSSSNAFTVHVPGGAPSVGGVPHLTAVDGNHTAVVKSWFQIGDEAQVNVLLFDAFGNPAGDRDFTMQWRYGGNPTAREAYCWANNATASSYTPLGAYSWNGDRGAPTVARTAIGSYTVTFPNLGSTGPEYGNVQVTPYGTSLTRPKVTSWSSGTGDLVALIRVRDVFGNLTDGRFIVSYSEVAAPIAVEHGSGAHVWADQPTATSYTPHSAYTDSNGRFGPSGAETIDRLSTGRYRVNLPDIDPTANPTVKVSGHTLDSTYASIESFDGNGPSGMQVIVQVWNATGSPWDGRFTLQCLTNATQVTPATVQTVGSGCNGPQLTSYTRPVLCRDWNLRLTGLPNGVVLGFVQLDFVNPALPLGSNAPGCVAHTGGAVSLLMLPPFPDPIYSLTMPGDPSFLGLPIFAQAGAFVPGLNPYGLAASNGLEVTIGDY